MTLVSLNTVRAKARFTAVQAVAPDRGWQIVENGQHVLAWTPSKAAALFIAQALSAYWQWLRIARRVQSWRQN